MLKETGVETGAAVVFTVAVALVVMFVFETGPRQALYTESHMETRVTSPDERQVSSAVAHLFLHCA